MYCKPGRIYLSKSNGMYDMVFTKQLDSKRTWTFWECQIQLWLSFTQGLHVNTKLPFQIFKWLRYTYIHFSNNNYFFPVLHCWCQNKILCLYFHFQLFFFYRIWKRPSAVSLSILDKYEFFFCHFKIPFWRFCSDRDSIFTVKLFTPLHLKHYFLL